MDDAHLTPGPVHSVRHDQHELAVRRKRMLDEDEDTDHELITPKHLRESYEPRQHVALVGSELRPAVFNMPNTVASRLSERASPTKPKRAPLLFSPRDLEHSQRAAHRMEQALALPYVLDAQLDLPTSFQQLIIYHKAVEHSLLVHMATHGAPAAEPCTPSSRQQVVIPNVLTFQRLRPLVERTCRRSFSVADFRRLVWLWSHAPDTPDMPGLHTGGMGFRISRVRTVDMHTSRRMYDWAIGIEMSLHQIRAPPLKVHYGPSQNGTKSMERPHSPLQTPAKSPTASSPPQTPSRDDLSHLAVWNAGIDERHMEIKYRLTHLVAAAHAQWLGGHPEKSLDACLESGSPYSHEALAFAVSSKIDSSTVRTPSAALAPPLTPTSTTKPHSTAPQGYNMRESGLLTPAASRSSDGHAKRVVMDVSELSPPASPLAARSQHLETPMTPPSPSMHGSSRSLRRVSRRLVRWHPDFSLDSLPPIPLAQLPPLAALPSELTKPTSTTSSPMSASAQSPMSKVVSTPVQARPQSLEERIRAKEQAIRATTQASNSMSALQERSVLSRLGEMADAIYVLYTSLPSTQAAHGDRRSSVLPLNDVLASLEKSARVAMSRAESRACLDKLMHIVPGWLEPCTIGSRTWLKLHHDAAPGRGLREVRKKIHAAMTKSTCR